MKWIPHVLPFFFFWGWWVWMGCLLSQLAAKFAFFPPSPATYQIKKRDDGRLAAVTSSSSSPEVPISSVNDSSMDVLSIDTKRGNKIVAFYLRNPYARLTLLYSHGNAADLGQLYDLFLQLKFNLRVNVMGFVAPFSFPLTFKLFIKRRQVFFFSFGDAGSWDSGFFPMLDNSQMSLIIRVSGPWHDHLRREKGWHKRFVLWLGLSRRNIALFLKILWVLRSLQFYRWDFVVGPSGFVIVCVEGVWLWVW